MNGSIICGVDELTESRIALRVAARLAEQLELPLVVAHASQIAFFAPPDGSSPVMAAPISQQLRAGQELLERVAAEESLVQRACMGCLPSSWQISPPGRMPSALKPRHVGSVPGSESGHLVRCRNKSGPTSHGARIYDATFAQVTSPYSHMAESVR